MKVLAINASPKGKEGFTEKILQPILEGMRKTGAETETIYLADKKIHHCIGCLSCWLKTPGKCIFNDDMDLLLAKHLDAELIIIGTPLYCFTMTGLLKNFLDRNIPLALPFMEKSTRTGLIFHPARFPGKQKKYLLVSSCGFPELSHFDALVATIKQLINSSEDEEYLGEILRPAAGMIAVPQFESRAKSYFKLLTQAGSQIIKNNKIDPELHAKLHQEWITQDDFIAKANTYFASVLPKIEKC